MDVVGSVPASDVYDPQIRRVDVSGSTLRIASAGSGPPLLMINGIGATVEMWRPLAARLSRSRSLVMFDAPGAGWSPAAQRPLRMSGLARMLVELLDELGLAQVDVLGYSWGGALAQQLARDAPSRVRRLVLAATSPGLGSQPPSPVVLTMMASSLRFASKSYLNLVAPFIYGGDARRPDARQRTMMDSWMTKPPTRRGYTHQLYAISTWSSLAWLRAITAPTLVIQGDDDPLVPIGNGRMIMQRLPNARLHLAVGGGHLWLLERPDDGADLVNRFLTRSGS